MKKMLSILVLLLLLSPVYGGLAQATYYHFEDTGQANVYFATNDSFTWKFDLDEDTMRLWSILEIPLTSGGTVWKTSDSNYAGLGNMSDADILHRAYLTMKFINVNDGNHDAEVEEIYFALDLATIVTSWYITQGGLSPDSVPSDLDPLYDSGGLNVLSYMEDDHLLYVTIKAIQGNFTVEKMDLTGCYESQPAPVPEPGTLVLLGMGFVLLSVLLRRKVRLAPSKTRR
ncbi:MAG: PEP-CTERM sorting domain-containing protein [Pelobacteraceae bacterium]